MANDTTKEGQLNFFQSVAEGETPEQKSTPSNPVINYLKNIGKASIEGVAKAGEMVSPEIPTYEGIKQKERFPQELERAIPSEEGGPLTKASERFLKDAPSMMLLPGASGGLAARVGGSSVLEQLGEEFGLGETGQTVLGLTAYLGPNMSSKLFAKGKTKELIEKAREFGLSDKQIAPLINSENKQKILSALAKKGKKSQQTLAETKQGISNVFEDLKGAGKNLTLNPFHEARVISEIQDKMFEMPSSLREFVSEDLADLTSKEITGDSLINFWQDINHEAIKEGNEKLFNLKKPIKQALQNLDPKLAKDFEFTNKLYGKYKNIASRLKPTLLSGLLNASKGLRILTGITTGYYPILAETLGEAGVRKLAENMLINPRYQQISRKMVQAMKKNSLPAIKKIADNLIKQVKDDSPQAAKALQSIDWSEWDKIAKEK